MGYNRISMANTRPIFVASLSVLLFGLSFAITAEATDYVSSLFTVKDPVLFPSGYATSSGYSMTVTIGQPSIGTSTAAAGSVRELRSGFEYFPFVNKPVVTTTPGDGFVGVSWTASTGFLGWTVTGYNVGKSTVSGGPYTYYPVSSGINTTIGALANGTTYYFVVIAKDIFGNFIATSAEVTGTPSASITPRPIPPSTGNKGAGAGAYVPPSLTPIVIPPFTAPLTSFCHTVADLNCDGYVDIVDFSIMYYWFDKTNPPPRVDLLRDGTVDLADFSVMAYYWHERN